MTKHLLKINTKLTALLINSSQIQDTSTSPTLSRLLTAGLNKGGSLKSDKSGECGQAADADSLCVEMNDLMHDYEVISRISDLVVQLKGKYEVRTNRQVC